ncbi:SIS domain-containing protein [Labrys monachus]|uniref:Glutamine--fructose-6-phosphate aminotransferase [isomerizing] n=1 Tax=Labrys monachus TaxID=217067 RepID=A0ABU0FNN7_9HYPH|nr:SIS domain-containing protein [Labrys monachus]MDQ0395688.1 glucosamine 6-phosphate synthetase-like amidotransferase/phosphosugar isomerase protein [Labrys monachus]
MQPGFVRDNVDAMLDFMRGVVAPREPGTLRHGFMIGCGDSYCAALAARQHMSLATGRFIEPVEALEFSRYLVGHLPEDSFVFGISNSGTVSRTIEGVRLARERGAWTFGVTVSADNRLARTAETLIKVNATPNIKEQPDGTRVVTPGTITYTASMLGLVIAGIALGERIGNLDAAEVAALVADLHALPDAMAKADAVSGTLAEAIAASFTKDRKTVILGGGPNYATAYFGMAKWFEGLTRPCHLSELEEWAHEHYFITDEMTDTIIILPPGAGHDRGLEQAQAAREMGSRIIIIGEEGDEEAKAACDIFFAMPPVPETLSPFVYKAPFEYLSCHISDKQGIAFLGFDNRKRQEVNFRQIFNSAQKAESGAAA